MAVLIAIIVYAAIMLGVTGIISVLLNLPLITVILCCILLGVANFVLLLIAKALNDPLI